MSCAIEPECASTVPVNNYEHTFCLSSLSEVPAERRRLAEACRALGVEDDVVDAWQLVFSELVNNAVEHGCVRSGDTVSGRVEVTDEHMLVAVTDPTEGEMTDESFAGCDMSEFVETGRGAGMFLVQTFSDEVRVEEAPDGGTTVTVVKHRSVVEGGHS